MKFNLADVFEAVVDAVPERILLSFEGIRPRTRRWTGRRTKWRTCSPRTGSAPSTTSHCSSRTASSTCSRCWGSSRSARCRSTSTTGTPHPSSVHLHQLRCARHHRRDAGASAHARDARRQAPRAADRVRDRRDRSGPRGRGRRCRGRRPGAVRRRGGPVHRARLRGAHRREHYIIYTGGTTGYPKGVVWQHDDFFRKPLSAGVPYGGEPRQNLDEVGRARSSSRRSPSSWPRRSCTAPPPTRCSRSSCSVPGSSSSGTSRPSRSCGTSSATRRRRSSSSATPWASRWSRRWRSRRTPRTSRRCSRSRRAAPSGPSTCATGWPRSSPS